MLQRFTQLIALAAAVGVTPLLVAPAQASRSQSGAELPAYLQCVPYARQQSGISIYGDAHTWWKQAQGRFDRGSKPRLGAVMAFQPHRNMRLGHVAAVSKIIDSRTILLRHANWSPINGRRGQIENDVRAIDVSRSNDWSQVRVWYDPIKGLGKTAWPIHGFIYSDKAPRFTQPARVTRVARSAPARQVAPAPYSAPKPAPSPAQTRRFANAFSDLGTAPTRQAAPRRSAPRSAPTVRRNQTRSADQVTRAVSLYD